MKARRVPAKRIRQTATGFRSPESSGSDLSLMLATVEAERDNLSRAESLLRCLKIAMEYGTDSDLLPYYPDVAQLAGEMVRKSIDALDPINLPTSADNKVRESSFLDTVESAMPRELSLLALATFAALPRKSVFRLHRRNYSRLPGRDASSSASASANTSGRVAR
jgi:hypothetical protein